MWSRTRTSCEAGRTTRWYWAVIGQSEALLSCDWSEWGNTELWLVPRSASGTLTGSSGWGTSWCGRWPTSTTTRRTSWRWTWRTGPATGGSPGTGPSDSAASGTPSGCIIRTSTTATLGTPCTGGHKIFNVLLKKNICTMVLPETFCHKNDTDT